ncbi:MAG: type II toxin-antitoxin system VapC family toxin [Thermoanaerobaculia bacterium]
MTESVLVDTGPLVAFLNARDRHHEWTKAVLSSVQAPLFTCDAVLSEACFLLRHTRGGADAVLKLVERGLLRAAFRLEAETPPVRRLLARYANVPMSLADACLVRMSEQMSDAVLLTLDRDFKVYRRHGRHVIRTMMPEGF